MVSKKMSIEFLQKVKIVLELKKKVSIWLI